MTVKFTGSVAAVEAGLEAGIKEAKDRDLYVTSKIISRVGEGTEKMAAINALGRDKLR
jgi:microcompartment protein CcmL/EutN